jgi:hypothetical protein
VSTRGVPHWLQKRLSERSSAPQYVQDSTKSLITLKLAAARQLERTGFGHRVTDCQDRYPLDQR